MSFFSVLMFILMTGLFSSGHCQKPTDVQLNFNPDKLGYNCSNLMQPCATPGSVCIDHVCKCQEGFVETPFKDMCFRAATNVGDSCRFEDQCTSTLGLSVCRALQCRCVNGAIPSPDNSECIEGEKKILIGQPCTDSHQCVGHTLNSAMAVTSECTVSGRCSCRDGFIFTINLDDCIPILKELGDLCDEKQQCQLGVPGLFSTCAVGSFASGSKVCNCTEESTSPFHGSSCYPVKDFEYCEVHEQCLPNRGFCINGECRL